jgi:poly-gamma-glutamate system protein
MKKIYWRPRAVSRNVLLLIALFSVVCFVAVEQFQTRRVQPWHREKVAAARLCRKAFEVVKTERLRVDPVIDTETDPALTGLIGSAMTPVTSGTGSLGSKQTSVNPNFAAVVLHMLRRAGVEPGDVVAVGYSGSFPAINIAVLAALQTLNVRPIIISSIAASQWGANHPDFLWPDMERVLFERNVFTLRSVAGTIGGIEDRGYGMSRGALRTIQKAMERNNLANLVPASYAESVEKRTALYREYAQGDPVKAYINVGGGTSSVGRKPGKHQFEAGLNLRPPGGPEALDSVMKRFAEEGTPVIHLVRLKELARRYGLPTNPTTVPLPGEGDVFVRVEYNLVLTAMLLVAIIASLFVFVRSDVGFRIFARVRRGGKESEHPEPMV